MELLNNNYGPGGDLEPPEEEEEVSPRKRTARNIHHRIATIIIQQ